MVEASRRCRLTISLAHLDAELGVEIGERLVEEEGLRLLDDGAADGDALALAAGKLRRLPLEEMRDLQDLGGAADARLDLGLRQFLADQAEAEVLAHAHVRIEGIGLEDHRHAARRRDEMVAAHAVEMDLAVADLLEPGDHAEQRRLPAAGRADEDGERAVVDGKIDAVDDLDRLEALADAFQFKLGHGHIPTTMRSPGCSRRRLPRRTASPSRSAARPSTVAGAAERRQERAGIRRARRLAR